MPDMIRFSSGHYANVARSCCRGRRMRQFLEDSPNSRGAEMQARAAQYLGDLDLTETWAQRFEALHCVTYEIGELVDRLTDLYEGIGALLIESLHSRRDGCSCHK